MPNARFADRVAAWKPTGDPGRDHAFCVELLEKYLLAAPAEQSDLRAATQQNPAVWHPTGADALSEYLSHADAHGPPAESLRTALTVCAVTGGLGDWRDTIVWLTRQWHQAVGRGIDPAPHFDELGDTADDGNVHGASGLSTRGLIRSAAVNAMTGRDDGVGPASLPPSTLPCPACGAALRTARARQCFACGADWHAAPIAPARVEGEADATCDRTNTRVSQGSGLETAPTRGRAGAAEGGTVPDRTPGDR